MPCLSRIEKNKPTQKSLLAKFIQQNHPIKNALDAQKLRFFIVYLSHFSLFKGSNWTFAGGVNKQGMVDKKIHRLLD